MPQSLVISIVEPNVDQTPFINSPTEKPSAECAEHCSVRLQGAALTRHLYKGTKLSFHSIYRGNATAELQSGRVTQPRVSASQSNAAPPPQQQALRQPAQVLPRGEANPAHSRVRLHVPLPACIRAIIPSLRKLHSTSMMHHLGDIPRLHDSTFHCHDGSIGSYPKSL